MLEKEDTGLVIVDVQDKLMPVIERREEITKNIIMLVHLARLFNLPILLTEQHSKWLGSTLQEIREVLPEYSPVEKIDFNCCAVDLFNRNLERMGLKNIILAGVESHICIMQTCIGLLAKGYQIHIPQDAVGSRKEENRQVGLELMRGVGAVITSTETVIYQILKRGNTKEFREMLKLVK